MGKEICHRDRIRLTILLAQAASDAAYQADIHQCLSFCVRITLHKRLLVIWDQFDQMFRAGCDTLTAGLAFFLIYHGYSINNMDCIEWACLYTGSKSQTPIGTSLWAAVLHHIYHNTVFNSLVLILILCFFSRTGALHKCDLPFLIPRSNPHNLADLGCNR